MIKNNILLITMFVIFSMNMGSIAFEVEFYGEIRLGVWSEKMERWTDDTIGIDTTWNDLIGLDVDSTITMGADSIPIYPFSMMPHGKFGCKIKGNHVEGCLEMGIVRALYDANQPGVTSSKHSLLKEFTNYIHLRKWYLNYIPTDFLSFLIGQDYPPATMVISDQAYMDNYCMVTMGCLYTRRKPMVQAKLDFNNASSISFSYKVAAVKLDTMSITAYGKNENTEVEVRTPKFENALSFGVDKELFGLNLYGLLGYSQFYSNIRGANDGILLDGEKTLTKISSLLFGGKGEVKIGPVSFSGTYARCTNPGSYGMAVGNPFLPRYSEAGGNAIVNALFYPVHAVATGDSTYTLYNSTLYQGAFVLKAKIGDYFQPEAGFGIVAVEHEYDRLDEWWKNNRYTWYVQTGITIAGKFRLIPEVGQLFWGSSSIMGGRFTYYGIASSFEF